MNRIKYIMRKKGLTQRDLEIATGLQQSVLSRIINDRKTVNIETAKKIARALGESIEHIWPD